MIFIVVKLNQDSTPDIPKMGPISDGIHRFMLSLIICWVEAFKLVQQAYLKFVIV